jgi:hypothetical protein
MVVGSVLFGGLLQGITPKMRNIFKMWCNRGAKSPIHAFWKLLLHLKLIASVTKTA